MENGENKSPTQNLTRNIIIFGLILIAAFAGYYLFNKDTPDTAGGWKKYKDTAKGFEIEYPPYLKVESRESLVMFADISTGEKIEPNKARILISIIVDNKFSFDEILKQTKESGTNQLTETITMAGEQAIHSVESDYGISVDLYTVLKESNIYVLEFPDSETVDGIKKIPEEDRQRMIGSFRFVN